MSLEPQLKQPTGPRLTATILCMDPLHGYLTKSDVSLFSYDVRAAFASNPDFVDLACRHVNPSTRSKGLLLVSVIFRVRDSERAGEDEMRRQAGMAVRLVVCITSEVS